MTGTQNKLPKTFLIRNAYSKQIVFEFSGIHNATLKQQLKIFTANLSAANGSLPIAKPVSWIHAFAVLTDFLNI